MCHCFHTCCSHLSPSELPQSFLPVLLRLWMEPSRVSCLSIFFPKGISLLAQFWTNRRKLMASVFGLGCKQGAKYAALVEIDGLLFWMICGVCSARPHHRSENGPHRWWFHVCWKSGMALFHVAIQSNHRGEKINQCNFIEDFGWSWIPVHENNMWF